MAIISIYLILAALLSPQQSTAPAAAATLDYEVFKDKVQPILTSPRKGNARCIACHSRGGGNAIWSRCRRARRPTPRSSRGATSSACQRLVVPGDPLKSILLINPLAEEAGGSHWHGGGKHWQSQNDPEWQTLAAWVRNVSPTAASGPRPATPQPRPRRRRADRSVQDARAADPDQPAEGQRALHRVSLARRRQQLSRAAVARRDDLQRGADRAATSSASSGWSCRASR